MSENILDSWLGEDFDFTESLDGEFGEFMDDAEAYDDSEGAESLRRRTRQGQRQMRIRQAQLAANRNADRQRRLGRRTPTLQSRGSSMSSGVQMAQAGIRKVDLESKVQGDILSRAIQNQQGRMRGTENAIGVSALMNELKVQFPNFFQGELGTFLPLASLLLLRPQKKGDGINALFGDIRFLIPASILALRLFNNTRGQQFTILPSVVKLKAAAPGNTGRLIIRDKLNRPINPPPQAAYTPVDEGIATVDAGKVTAVAAGTTFIDVTVTLNGVSSTVSVPVEVS